MRTITEEQRQYLNNVKLVNGADSDDPSCCCVRQAMCYAEISTIDDYIPGTMSDTLRCLYILNDLPWAHERMSPRHSKRAVELRTKTFRPFMERLFLLSNYVGAEQEINKRVVEYTRTLDRLLSREEIKCLPVPSERGAVHKCATRIEMSIEESFYGMTKEEYEQMVQEVVTGFLKAMVGEEE